MFSPVVKLSRTSAVLTDVFLSAVRSSWTPGRLRVPASTPALRDPAGLAHANRSAPREGELAGGHLPALCLGEKYSSLQLPLLFCGCRW